MCTLENPFAGSTGFIIALITRAFVQTFMETQVFFKRSHACTIDGPAGVLQLVVNGVSRDEWIGVAVLCHPHPLYGGTMDNKVVHTLMRACRDVGIACVRFNFRGVGASSGQFDGGRGEREDLGTVVGKVRSILGGAEQKPLIVGGFSFGGSVAAAFCSTPEGVGIQRLLLVAPAIGKYGFSPVMAPSCPALVVQGGNDEVLDPQTVRQWAGNLDNVDYEEMIPAGHFFHGELVSLKRSIDHWLCRQK
jgi:alpha/beta superfamily hydrolase